jgi:hypothetical protein
MVAELVFGCSPSASGEYRRWRFYGLMEKLTEKLALITEKSPINSQKDMLLDQNGNVIKVKVPQQHMLEYLGTIAAF